MAEFKAFVSGETEQTFRKVWARLFQQSTTAGIALKGVLGSGLVVAQTSTASANVEISAGLAVAQDTVGNGVSPLLNDGVKTLDVLTANPMGGTPRNDMVVFDAATSTIRVIVGTPNAVPTDPAVPSTAVALARLRHAASATTVTTAKIDDLRTFARLLDSPKPFSDYYRSSAGLIASGVTTKLAFTNKVEATGITYSLGDFTVSEAGRYLCTFEVMFGGSAGLSNVGAQIWVNGAYKAFTWDTASTTANWSSLVSRTLRLNAGDVVSFYARHNATADLPCVADAGATWCQISYQGA